MQHTTRPFVYTGLIMALSTACELGFEVDETEPDGPPALPIRPVDPLPGGGILGPPVTDAEAFTVFVHDEHGQAVADATILVHGAGPAQQTITDAEGRADLALEAGLDAVDVHVFSKPHRFESLFGVQGSVLTVTLTLRAPEEEAAPTSALTLGTISGWDLLDENDGRRARVAEVFPIGPGLTAFPQPPRPGTVTPGDPDGSPLNLAVNGTDPFPRWTDYALKLDTRARGLVVFGGIFDTEDTPETKVTHLGVRTAMDLAGAGTLTGQDLTFTHALDRPLEARFADDTGLEELAVTFAVALEEGRVPLPTSRQRFAMAPALTGELASATYVASVTARSSDEIAGQPEAESTSTQTDSVETFILGELLTPPGAPTAAGRTLGALPSDQASLHSFVVSNPTTRDRVWRARTFGAQPRSLTLPTPPAGHADPLRGTLLLEVHAADHGSLDPAATPFRELAAATRATAVRRGLIDL